jgi:putative heme-binding domain-containing protein
MLYRFPADTWITDIEIRGDDLYAMTNAALYRFAGGRLKREDLQPERLLWGSPVDLHVTWHGLAWGPEGNLYFSSGDPLLNYGDFARRPDHWGHWTIYGPGEKLAYTGVGGFYRCRADGTGLKVVAGGTRGAVGVAFDRRWNLFSNDNDHESIADRYSPARLLHVAPQSHFFWPRGWIASMSPERSDLLDVVNTGMGREVPVGQAYLDEPALGERYADSVLVARWGQRRVSGYRLSPYGATYRGEEYPLLVGEELARPVGVTVGRGGRMFVALAYMAGNEWSPKYPSEIVVLEPANALADSFVGYDAVAATPERLWQELASSSALQRQQAHTEILRRGGKLLEEAIDRLHGAKTSDPAVTSLIWLSAASSTPTALEAIEGFLNNQDPLLRAAAVRALAAFPAVGASHQRFVNALADEDARVRQAAVVALFDREEPLPDVLLRGPACESDTYVRQAATLLIARRGTRAQIESLLASDDPSARLAGVLAAGFRLTVPPAVGELPADLPLKYESGNAEFTIQYADAKLDLKSLGRIGSFTTAESWKYVPHTNEQQVLFTALAKRLADADDRVYEQAAFFLNLFDVAEINQQIDSTRRARILARLNAAPAAEVSQVWAAGPFDDGAASLEVAHPPEQGPIDLAATYGPDKLSWRQVSIAEAIADAPADKHFSSYAYFRLQSRAAQPALFEIAAPGAVKLWHNGRPMDTTIPILLALEPGSNDLLLRTSGSTENKPLVLRVRAVEPVTATLPEKLGLATLAERLKSACQSEAVPPEFLSVDWSTAARTGSAVRGRRLFSADALGCVKCHAVLENQKGGGAPSLAGALKRFTPAHLVESILTPSKQVAPVFGTTTVVTADGQSLSGLVVAEDETRIVLLLPTAARQEVAKSDIEVRRLHETSPMPSGLVKTPAELADLLAYLLSENPQAP